MYLISLDFLVNQKYFMYLISLDFSQRTPGLCQTPDAENFAKVFSGLIPLNILTKNSVS